MGRHYAGGGGFFGFKPNPWHPQVVGASGTPFLYNGAFPLVDLSPLREAWGINDASLIVGAVKPSGSGSVHPAYRAPNGTIDLRAQLRRLDRS